MKFSLESAPHQVRLALRDIRKQIAEAQLLMAASSLAYTTILSLIPLLAVSFSIFQAFGGMDRLYALIEPLVLKYVAEAASDEALTAIRNYIGRIHAGALGATGMLGLIITSFLLLSSAESAINRVWKAPIKRTLFQRIASYWLIVTLGPLTAAIALGFITSSQVSLNEVIPSGVDVFLISVGIFFLIYKLVPNRPVDWKPALISATVAAGLFNIARAGYGLYTSEIVSYNRIYGSLGAVPIMLVWIYICWLVVLSGAAMTAALQKRFDFD